jgi:hypothetical protein
MTTVVEGVRGQRHSPSALYPRERLGIHCTGGWLGPRAGLDRCEKSRPPPGFDPRTVQPVSSRYTNNATRPTVQSLVIIAIRKCPQGTPCSPVWKLEFFLRGSAQLCEGQKGGGFARLALPRATAAVIYSARVDRFLSESCLTIFIPFLRPFVKGHCTFCHFRKLHPILFSWDTNLEVWKARFMRILYHRRSQFQTQIPIQILNLPPPSPPHTHTHKEWCRF